MIVQSKSIKADIKTRLGKALNQNKTAQITEIIAVFISAVVIIEVGKLFVDDNPFFHQIVVWIANMIMLFLVWLGLRIRGQNVSHLGLNRKNLNVKAFLLSLAIFIIAVLAFAAGSVIMAAVAGIPEKADMSGYNFLQDNFLMLAGALLAVFIASSFGEEFIYRGFLITRITELGDNSKNWVKISVVISALIFGLIHFDWGITGIVQTAFMGLVLGISFIVLKRNLWVIILAHAYMDAILLIQMYFGVN